VVFGEGKWAADAVVSIARHDTWIRFEVRSSDSNTAPRKKGARKLSKIADAIAEVRATRRYEYNVRFWRLYHSGRRKGHKVNVSRIDNPSNYQLAKWLRYHFL